MTRFPIAILAACGLFVCACEKHPLQNQTPVTHTHGSNGAHDDHHKDEHKKPVDEATKHQAPTGAPTTPAPAPAPAPAAPDAK